MRTNEDVEREIETARERLEQTVDPALAVAFVTKLRGQLTVREDRYYDELNGHGWTQVCPWLPNWLSVRAEDVIGCLTPGTCTATEMPSSDVSPVLSETDRETERALDSRDPA
jgi:hypothetical protein